MEQHQAIAETKDILLVGISMGAPKHIRRYCDKLAPRILCLVDEGTESYEAYGLQRTDNRSMLSLDVAKGLLKAFSQGHVGGQAVGDVKMMPGSFLVDMGGIVRFVHYNEHIGDHSDLNEVTATL